MLWPITVASAKMYMRQKEVLIWTFFFPLLLVSLFGFIRFDGLSGIHLGVVNEAGGAAQPLLAGMREVKALHLFEGTEASERTELRKGERDAVLIIPASFDSTGGGEIRFLADREAKPRETQLGILVVQRVLDEYAFRREIAPHRTLLRTEAVVTRNLTYVDFLLPGVLSMSIMQLGVFGVAFGFVSLKRRGVLRRLKATPMRPATFIVAQMLTRVAVLVVQMALLVGFGIVVLGFHLIGNFALLVLIGMLGASVFLSLGFAIAGVARSEDHVPPLANVVTLPMILLSGVFFSRSHLPELVRTITGVLPLTFLSDGLRAVAIDGAGIVGVLPQIGGLLVWAVICVALAAKTFRWE